jgi:hypothetical protein
MAGTAAAQQAVGPRISYNRREAAELLGVSPTTIKKAKLAGHLKAKSTSRDKDGNPTGVDLYTYEDLKAWFDGLTDA